MNNLFPLNIRQIDNVNYANDNYSLSTEQSIMAQAKNVPATGTCTTTVATILLDNHGYIVGDTVNLVGTGVFTGAVVVTAVNQNSFNYTVSTTAVTTPVAITVTVVTVQVNEYVGTMAPRTYMVTQTLAQIQAAAPYGAVIPVTIVGTLASSSYYAPANPLAYSALIFTGKTVNMRKSTGDSLVFTDMDRASTTVTVTCVNHGLQVGEYVNVLTSTTTALQGVYAVATVPTSDTFTYTTTTSGTVTNATGTGYHEFTKIMLYKEGARNIGYVANEYYALLTPYLASQDINYTPAAVNATATLTAAQVVGGYITSTSAAAVTLTMPTGTLLGAALNAQRGTIHNLYIDNTAGANTITIAVGTNAVQSDWDNQLTAATASVTPAAVTPLTIASGVSGTARYTIVFSSSTAYTFSRTA